MMRLSLLLLYLSFILFFDSTFGRSFSSSMSVSPNVIASANTSSPQQTTSSPSTTSSPTPPPPVALTVCQQERLNCNFTYWACLRGNEDRCACVGENWRCLKTGLAASCSSSQDDTSCQVDGRRLVCPALPCPAEAGERIVDGTGWIIALVFFLLSIVLFAAVVGFVCWKREWCVTARQVASEVAEDRNFPAVKAPPASLQGIAIPEEAEPNDLIVLPPHYVRDYRERMVEAGYNSSPDFSPNLPRSNSTHLTAAGLGRVELEDLTAAKQDELAAVAYQNRVAEEELQILRQHLKVQLAQEREALAKQIAHGNLNLKDPMPSDFIATENGLQPSPSRGRNDPWSSLPPADTPGHGAKAWSTLLDDSVSPYASGAFATHRRAAPTVADVHREIGGTPRLYVPSTTTGYQQGQMSRFNPIDTILEREHQQRRQEEASAARSKLSREVWD